MSFKGLLNLKSSLWSAFGAVWCPSWMVLGKRMEEWGQGVLRGPQPLRPPLHSLWAERV